MRDWLTWRLSFHNDRILPEGSVTSPARARDSIAMARLVHGAEFMEENAVMQGNINVNSPFVFDGAMSEALRVYAEANQCVCVSPAILGGAMGLAGACVTGETRLPS